MPGSVHGVPRERILQTGALRRDTKRQKCQMPNAKCTNSQMHKFTNAQIYKCPNAQMPKFPSAQMPKCPNAQIHNFQMPNVKCQLQWQCPSACCTSPQYALTKLLVCLVFCCFFCLFFLFFLFLPCFIFFCRLCFSFRPITPPITHTPPFHIPHPACATFTTACHSFATRRSLSPSPGCWRKVKCK